MRSHTKVLSGLFLLLGCAASQPLTSQPALPPASLPETSSTSPRPAPQPLTAEMRGDIFMARKMYREAIEVYRGIPAESAIIANKIGIAYHQMLLFDQAKKQYERAMKLSPKYPEAINNLGTIYYAKRSYRRATNLYKKALDVNPNSASILSNLGTAFFARKKYAEAFEAYQKALAIDPEVFEHRGNSGVLLQERSVQERAKFHFYLAKTYAKAGNVERALQYMRKAIEEGFKEREKFVEEPEFAGLKDNPEFQQLLKMEARVL